MSVTLTHFEVIIPNLQGNDVNGNPTPQDVIVDAFLNSVASLSPFAQNSDYTVVDTSGNITQFNQVVGSITAAQSSTALVYLSTLNTALGYNVPCISYQVITHP